VESFDADDTDAGDDGGQHRDDAERNSQSDTEPEVGESETKGPGITDAHRVLVFTGGRVLCGYRRPRGRI
jgi:hypothetical protein